MGRRRSRSHSRSPHYRHGHSRSPHRHRGYIRSPHRRHRYYSPGHSCHTYDTSHSDYGRTHPGYSSTNYSVPLVDRLQLASSYVNIPVRIPNHGPPQSSSGCRFQGNYQQNNSLQNSDTQQHTWQNPIPVHIGARPFQTLQQWGTRPPQTQQQWGTRLPQVQQQQQQWGTRPLQAHQQQQQQCQGDVDLIHITMTQLPFFEILATPIKIKILPHETFWTSCTFGVENSLLEYFRGIPATSSYHVQIRFCNFVKGIEQKDHFPRDLQIEINGSPCLLPGWNIVPKQPAEPIEITSKCDFQRNKNIIKVKSCIPIVMFVHVTRRLTHEELLEKLLKENPIDPAATVARIKEKLEEDTVNEADITLTSLQFSLMCPVSKTRMKLPCRASTCQHLQCFDAAYYLKMNEKKPTWRCPICSEVIEYKNLQIDMHFKNILEQNISTDKILLQIDGSCAPFQPKDVDQSILTLDDTLDQSANEEEPDYTSRMEPPPTTHKELGTDGEEAHITIDLFSEDESLLEEELPEERTGTGHAPSKDSQKQQVPEVVILSDDEAPVRNVRRASLRGSVQEVSAGQEATTTPASKRHKRRSKKKTTPKITTTTTTTPHIGNIGDDFIPLCTADLHLL
ncbi:hypothetical protein O3P69_008766 [Scylla paramamosain]|uniref:SP-RING-type domain-containing protein n=1 Tax=Scylla paramamosain TaxID=85552 RepID=A0AAW0SND9_SCYPA